MSNRIFLYKDNSDDRDCCAYIQPSRFECNHYFSTLRIEGACYSSHDFADYENIKTILTKDEYNKILEFNKKIDELGFRIEKGSDKYNYGIKLCKQIQPIFDKLESEKAKEFFKEIQQEEIEAMTDEYGLNEEDIEEIFNEYYLEYRDRAVIASVYNSSEDCGYEEAYALGYIDDKDNIQSRYFDYEKFGEDLVNEDENYIELNDGRVVRLNY